MAAAVVVGAVVSGGGSIHLRRLASGVNPAMAPAGAASRVDPIGPAAVQALIAAVSFNPGSGATGVRPDAPVTVTTTKGMLTSISLITGSDPALLGSLSGNGRTWTAAAGLAAGATYQFAVNVADRAGTKASAVETFATLPPTSTTTATVTPADGSTVGVGQPLVVKFSQPVPAAAQGSVLAHFAVVESQPVPGGWHWFTDQELHFRPQAYWLTGEQISLTGNLQGWDAGGGSWGAGQTANHVTIGDSHVSVANLSTQQMTVTDNGQPIATYAISGGSSEYPTMDGIHLAMDKEPVVHMVSGTVGIPTHGRGGYDEYVYNDVHISDSGEYVHDAPWSVGDQGRYNVSHGCINASPADSLAFYNLSQVGDVIEVTGGTRPPDAGDHGVMDWTLDWGQWTPAAVAQA